jgi:hypothetical protein
MTANEKTWAIFLVVVAVLSAFTSGFMWSQWIHTRTRYKRTTNRNLVE